jgi:hypothetical protein
MHVNNESFCFDNAHGYGEFGKSSTLGYTSICHYSKSQITTLSSYFELGDYVYL